ncbi:hypothetical protein PSPO_a1429 [Pseudoalteromonas spongiae UST010723-006]|nr:hypothetical protein PSPO_a1429 [Pseudoalteromonas spongiae UST010723-006]
MQFFPLNFSFWLNYEQKAKHLAHTLSHYPTNDHSHNAF